MIDYKKLLKIINNQKVYSIWLKMSEESNEYLEYEPKEGEEPDLPPQFKAGTNAKLAGITGSKQLIEETRNDGDSQDPMAGHGTKRIIDREDSYH